MAVETPYFSDKFCADIEYHAKRSYILLILSIKSDLQLYDDVDEKLGILNSQINEVRRNIEGSNYKIIFSVDNIKTNLNKYLKYYYRGQLISLATQVEYSKSMEYGKYGKDNETHTIVVYPLPWYSNRDVKFDFGFLDDFKPLVEHIAWGLLFLELKEMEAKIKNAKIVASKSKQPSIFIKNPIKRVKKKSIFPSKGVLTKSVKIVADKDLPELIDPILNQDTNKNGPITLDQVGAKENRITTKETPIINTSEDKKVEVSYIEEISQPKTTIGLLGGNEIERQNLLEYLKRTYSGQRPKTFAIMILTLEDRKLITYTQNSELYVALRNDFGNIGTNSFLNRILATDLEKDKKLFKLISLHSEKLRKHIENLPKTVV